MATNLTHLNKAQPSHQVWLLPLSSSALLALVTARNARYGCAQRYDRAHGVSRNRCIPLVLLPNED